MGQHDLLFRSPYSPVRFHDEIWRKYSIQVPYIDSEGGDGSLHARIHTFEIKGFEADHVRE
jgi:hypothetical protein